MATRLGDMAVGSTVKIKVDGTLKDFIIVQQGSPGAGDNDFDGTWLLMVNCVKLDWIYGKSGFPGTYFNTFVHPYFNGTFLSSLLPSIRSEIRTVHLCNMHGSDVYADCKVFALDEAEVQNISSNIAVLEYALIFPDVVRITALQWDGGLEAMHNINHTAASTKMATSVSSTSLSIVVIAPPSY